MKMKKGTIIAVVAGGAALLGGLVALALYLRAKARDLSERLDFDDDFYDEEDSLFEFDEDFNEGAVVAESKEDNEDDEDIVEDSDDIDSLPIADEDSDEDQTSAR